MKVLEISHTCSLFKRTKNSVWLTCNGQPLKVNWMHWIPNETKMSKSWNARKKIEIILEDKRSNSLETNTVLLLFISNFYLLVTMGISPQIAMVYSLEESPSMTFPSVISREGINTAIMGNSLPGFFWFSTVVMNICSFPSSSIYCFPNQQFFVKEAYMQDNKFINTISNYC